MKSHRPLNILGVADFFLPGFRGGGPVRTLENLRKQLLGDVQLAIFTRDRDLGAKAPYVGVKRDVWIESPSGPIYYASPREFGVVGVRKALLARSFDIAYLNSFFSVHGSILLNAWLAQSAFEIPVLIAPKGEFSAGALAVKKGKKNLFLELARRSALYRSVYWHASSDLEADDILRQFPAAENRVLIAPDPVELGSFESNNTLSSKYKGRLSIAFISRISPMKNLDGLLDYLRGIQSNVELDVYGPTEDLAYWKDCQTRIERLPVHIKVQHRGLLLPEEVSPTFARYDLFAFPTHGENFGHVIFEALRAGTPVLISNRTPWQADENGAVTALPLENVELWRYAIELAANRTQAEQAKIRKAAREYAEYYAATAGSRQANLALFRSLV